MSEFYVTAIIRVKEGANLDETKLAMKQLVRATIEEPDCQQFELYADDEDPRRFVLREQFTDADALKRHFEYPHTLEYLAGDFTEVVEVIKGDRLV